MKPIISPRQMHEGQRSEVGAIRRLERTIELLTKRIEALEAKRKPGRPAGAIMGEQAQVI